VIDPWTLTSKAELAPILNLPYGLKRKKAWERFNKVIGKRNRDAIDRSNFVVAVLDGQDVDSGTAAEIGYAFGVEKVIFGYRGDFRLAADNEGSMVNLQVEFFIRQSGGQITSTVAELLEKLKSYRASE
jgi:nucleoside 2-deoxyribosyltransferase